MIVGYQGEPGAFSDEAARRRFDNPDTRGYATFDEVVEALSKGHVELALLPIENSIVGPIVGALAALERARDVCTVDEIAHPVEQCLVGVRGASVETLVLVQSHPIALEQCRSFFSRNPHLRTQAVEDTAGAIRAIAQLGDMDVAAIGPAPAALRYGAVVLARGIQDRRDNVTRFAIVAPAWGVGGAGMFGH